MVAKLLIIRFYKFKNYMKKNLIVLSGIFLALVLVLAPVAAFAQVVVTNQNNAGSCGNGAPVTSIETGICKVGQLLNSIVPVLIALGIVYFVYGVVTYVIASDEEAKKSGRDRIIYGIIGLAVIVSVWGLVIILRDTFVPQGNTGTVNLPTIPFGN